MKKIFIVDDTPETKVKGIIKYLQERELQFEYVIKNSVLSAEVYLDNIKKSDIDLAIVDMGLPYMDVGVVSNSEEGLNVINTILEERLDVPVIINSSTVLNDEVLKKYRDKGMYIFQVRNIWDAQGWLLDFLKEEHS